MGITSRQQWDSSWSTGLWRAPWRREEYPQWRGRRSKESRRLLEIRTTHSIRQEAYPCPELSNSNSNSKVVYFNCYISEVHGFKGLKSWWAHLPPLFDHNMHIHDDLIIGNNFCSIKYFRNRCLNISMEVDSFTHKGMEFHGPLARYVKLRVRMRRECRERFPRHRRWAIPTCITARASRTCRDACRDR